MGLSVNNDLVSLSDNFESLKAKVEAIEIIVYGEKVLELDDSTWENIRKKKRLYSKIYRLDSYTRMLC